MKAEYFMIDNYIGYNSNKSYFIGKVKTINTNSVTLEKGVSIKYKNLMPIPLTEEWLIDFGSEYADGWDDSFYLIINNITVNIYGNPIEKGWKVESHNIGYNLDYVHQFQNLVFLLTGKQLTKCQ